MDTGLVATVAGAIAAIVAVPIGAWQLWVAIADRRRQRPQAKRQDEPVLALRRVLTGHRGPVDYLAVSPDGSWLASASRDETVRLWDPVEGRERATLTGHDDEVNALAVSPDGSWLASASDDATVRLWDPVEGRERSTLTGHDDEVNALAVSPDGSWLASAGADGTVQLWWDPVEGRERTTLTGHRGPVLALAVSRDGSWLASAGLDATVRLWGPVDATLLGVVHLDAEFLRACTWLSRQPPTIVLAGDKHLYVVEYRR